MSFSEQTARATSGTPVLGLSGRRLSARRKSASLAGADKNCEFGNFPPENRLLSARCEDGHACGIVAFRESAKNKAERALRIVGYRRAAVLLGFGLATVGYGPSMAQTVVGGDGRPAVEVDRSVLDTLGPTPTLPDLLLGRQPSNPATSPVKLHRPTGKASVAKAKEPVLTKPKAVAAEAPKLKEPKAAKTPVKTVAQAEPKPKAAKAETRTATDTGTPKSTAAKKLATNFEPPPKPPVLASAANANADMPGAVIEPTKPPPAPASSKTLSSSVTTPAPEKLTAAKSTETPPAPPAPATNAPAPVKTEAPKPEPAKATEAPAKTESPKAEAKAESKVALLTPPPTTSTTTDGGASTTIPFSKDGASLSDDGRGALVGVAKRALADSAIQLQVLAYASGDEDNASKARRLSLSRALAVRSFLIDQGVHSTRIEVRALGNKVPDGAPDRVDLVEQKH